MKNKNFKILDCTLRDGGYYTDWSFNTKLVRDLVKSLDSDGVDIIEMGYKSPVKGGPYRKCNDGFIKSIVNFKVKSKLCFMIDVKDYVKNNSIDIILLNRVIQHAASSPFSVCRIAAKYSEIKYLPKLVDLLYKKDYEVICNLMGVSLLKTKQIQKFVETTRNLPTIAEYIADSYGSLYPNDVKKIIKSGGINGIHTHDNLGLAFANCLVAIEEGATFIDGTLLGMGRGVGNVKTEQLLMYRNGSVSCELLDSIHSISKLHEKYGWGQNTTYMHAGIHNIHPLYAQDINTSGISNSNLKSALESLKNETSYDKNKLNPYLEQRAVVVIPARYKSSRFPGKPLIDILGTPMIIRVADIACKAVGIENVYIATEDRRIVDVVEDAGYKVILTSDNCLTGTDRIAEAAMEIDADIFIDVQGDEPLLDPDYIVKTIEEKKKYPNHVINCMARLESYDDIDSLKIPKMVVNLDNEIIYQSRSGIPGSKFGPVKTSAKKQVCVFAFNRQELEAFANKAVEGKTPLEWEEDLEMLRFLEMGMKLRGLEVDGTTHAVDVPEDVEIVEKLLKKVSG